FCAVDSATGRSSPVIVYRASANNAVSTDLSRPPRTAAGSLATLPADSTMPGAALDHELPPALRELSSRDVGCRSTLLGACRVLQHPGQPRALFPQQVGRSGQFIRWGHRAKSLNELVITLPYR